MISLWWHRTGGTPPTLGTQAGHMVVLVRFFVRLAVWDRFGTLFGPSWGYFWPLLVPFSAFLGPIFGLWMPFGTFFGSMFAFHLSLLRFSTFDVVDAARELGPADYVLRD